MSDQTFALMMTLIGFAGGLSLGYAFGTADTVCKSELEQNGYFVVRHEETHGEFHTNWVEVIRK